MRIIFQQSTLDAMQKSRFFTRGAEYPALKAASPQSGLNIAGKKDDKFLYFQKKIIEHIAELDGEEANEVKKSLFYMVDAVVKSKFPVGTIREWKGKKYIKIAPGKWRPKYDSNSRGAKLAVAALKRKAEQCKTSQELLQLVLENRDRFSDQDRKPLPFVQELSRYVSELNDRLENQAAKQPKAKVSEQPKGTDAVNDRNGNTESRNNILRAELKTVLKPFINKDIENNATKIIARISTEGTNKMGSGKAIQKSEKNGFTVDEHFEVAKKIIELYKQAQLVHTGKDEKIKDNPNILSIKRFVAETQLKSGKEADALITVKESKEAGHRIYSIELDEIKTASTRWQADTSEIPPNQGTATTEATNSIPQPEGKSSGNDTYPEKDYPEYKGKGQKAVDFIVKQKGGQVRGAFNRPEIGDIDVVWGKVTNADKHEGYGLAHIIDKHGIETVKKIGEVINAGDIVRPDNNPDRIAIENNNFHVGLRQQWNGKKKLWIITGFEKAGNVKTTRSNKDYTGETLPATSTTSVPQSGKKSSTFELDDNKKDGTAVNVPEYAYADAMGSVNNRSYEESIDFLEKKIAEVSENIEKYSFYKNDSRYVDSLSAYKKILAEFTKDKSIWAKAHIKRRKKDIERNNEHIEDLKNSIESYKKKLLEVEKAPSDSRFKINREKTLHTKQYTIKYYKEWIDNFQLYIQDHEEKNAQYKKGIKNAEAVMSIQKSITDILTTLHSKEQTIRSMVAEALQKQCG